MKRGLGLAFAASLAFGAGALVAQDLSGPVAFVPIIPCRQVDTRQATGGPGGPVTTAVMTLQVTGAAYPGVLAGANPCSATNGAPTGSVALALNLTMAGVAGPTDLRSAPQGTPPTSSIMNSSGSNIANSISLPVNTSNGQIDVKSGGANFNLIIDVFGYYTVTQHSGNSGFAVTVDNVFRGAAVFYNANSYCVSDTGSSCGLWVRSDSVNTNSSALTAFAWLYGAGVYAVGFDPAWNDPVYTTGTSAALVASSNNSDAIVSYATGGDAYAGFVAANGRSGAYGQAQTAGSWGIVGANVAAFNGSVGSLGNPATPAFCMLGVCYSTTYGVYGTGYDQYDGGTNTYYSGTGVQGVNASAGGVGVLGSGGVGVYGFAGNATSDGVQGWAQCYTCGYYGLYANGDIGRSGAYLSPEPHPTDPSKEIQFVTLEGPEAVTYFRGKGQILNGFGTIQIPESFRYKTDPDSVTVVATPVGSPAMLVVMHEGLDNIVIQGSADVAFNYVVNGVRRGYKDFNPITSNTDFRPSNPGDDSFQNLPAEDIARMKANGILKADGSVNMDTVHNLGWDKQPGWGHASANQMRAAAANMPQHPTGVAAPTQPPKSTGSTGSGQ
jgi:hypothetical protein